MSESDQSEILKQILEGIQAFNESYSAKKLGVRAYPPTYFRVCPTEAQDE